MRMSCNSKGHLYPHNKSSVLGEGASGAKNRVAHRLVEHAAIWCAGRSWAEGGCRTQGLLEVLRQTEPEMSR